MGFSLQCKTTIRWNNRSQLDDVIRSEVLKQVEEQVNAQIVEHIPVGLQQQAEESNKQVQDIKISLANSYVVIMITGVPCLILLANRGSPIQVFRAGIWTSLSLLS